MRLTIHVIVSDDFSYEFEDKVIKEFTVQGSSDVLESIPWAQVLRGVVEGGLGEFSVKQAVKTLEKIEGGEDRSIRDDMDDPVLGNFEEVEE